MDSDYDQYATKIVLTLILVSLYNITPSKTQGLAKAANFRIDQYNHRYKVLKLKFIQNIKKEN